MSIGLTPSSFSYFLVFCASMTFSPGPMTLLLLSLGLKAGLRQSLPAQLGASVAYLLSILIFALGFSALIQGYPLVRQLIQALGVAYVLYLAWRQWNSTGLALDEGAGAALEGFRALFAKGLLTGLSNPKSILMFSAVFPQFASQTTDIAVLGLTFLLLQFASGCLYCYFGQRIRHVLQQPARRRLLQRATAVLLVGVALMLLRGFDGT
ncbi:LysE family translocator [Pseudomonas aegrilactucae]|uniref:LysE family translocator n=1 Tax=Pseudomonas aegrilactucae TaxID=2854028 RepID=A0A9Q3ADT7_9PSED|nr:LysE family translocator [Pseudomonas aegrilactucae]MBV6286715.1 LysE family translocator [Pseudomonas aegrilactucae]